MVIDGFFCLLKIPVCITYISDVDSFTTPIANIPCNLQRLFMIIDSSFDLPQNEEGTTKFSYADPFTVFITNFL